MLTEMRDSDGGAIEFRRQEEYQMFQLTIVDFIQFSGDLTHRILSNRCGIQFTSLDK